MPCRRCSHCPVDGFVGLAEVPLVITSESPYFWYDSLGDAYQVALVRPWYELNLRFHSTLAEVFARVPVGDLAALFDRGSQRLHWFHGHSLDGPDRSPSPPPYDAAVGSSFGGRVTPSPGTVDSSPPSSPLALPARRLPILLGPDESFEYTRRSCMSLRELGFLVSLPRPTASFAEFRLGRDITMEMVHAEAGRLGLPWGYDDASILIAPVGVRRYVRGRGV